MQPVTPRLDLGVERVTDLREEPFGCKSRLGAGSIRSISLTSAIEFFRFRCAAAHPWPSSKFENLEI